MRQFQSARGPNFHANSHNTANLLADSSDAAAAEDGVLYGTEFDDVLHASAQFPHVIGLGGDDQIFGSAENNILEGNAGDDTISGGTGVDSIWGGGGVDTLTGGAGRDRFEFRSLAEAGDTITDFQATRYGDVIDVSAIAQQFNWDPIDPFGAGFITTRQSGSDTIVLIDSDGGGDGFQPFITVSNVSIGVGANIIFDPSVGQNFTPEATPPSAAEGDTLFGTPFNDVFYANAQYTHLIGFGGEDKLFGGVEDNILEGGADFDVLVGDDGNDRLDGGSYADWMEGGTGDDVYIFDHMDDVAIESSDSGYDIIVSSTSTSVHGNVEELILTGPGGQQGIGNNLDNIITGTDGVNELLGSSGNDTLYGLGGSDKIYGDGITDVVFDDDVLFGGDGNDWLYGGKGNDILRGGEGADVLSGSLGYDTAGYEDAQAAIVVDLMTPSANAGAAAEDTLSSIENLIGTAFDDTLLGGQSGNVLEGGTGDDQLRGRDGADTLHGGDGDDFLDGGARRDALTGGAGEDTFYFASTAEGGDTIADFAVGDHIALSAAGFGLESIEDFDFVLSSEPMTAMPTAIYNAATGNLSWDADGSGMGAAVQLATFSGAPALTHDDFLVI